MGLTLTHLADSRLFNPLIGFIGKQVVGYMMKSSHINMELTLPCYSSGRLYEENGVNLVIFSKDSGLVNPL